MARAVVGFEADELDLVHGTGWSVSVTGTAEPVDDPALVGEALGTLGHLLPNVRALHLVRVRTEIVTGRRL